MEALAAPFSLSDLAAVVGGSAARVEHGYVDIFAVRLGPDGLPVGRRRHVCRRLRGDTFWAMPVEQSTVGLVAVPSTDAELAPLDLLTLPPALASPHVDGWACALGKGAFAGAAPKESLLPKPGRALAAETGTALRSRDAVVWLSFSEGGAAVAGREELTIEAATTTPAAAVPVSAWPWLLTVADSEATVQTTEERLLAGADLEDDLAAYHVLALRALAADEARAEREDRLRAARRTERARGALREGVGHLASILSTGAAESEAAAGEEALLLAARRVGRELGVDVAAPADPARGGRRDHVGEIARASRLRYRKVMLSGEWWRDDFGAVLAMVASDGKGKPPRPVALVRRRGRTVMFDEGQEVVVTAEVAERVHPVAFTFYRPFPDRALTALDVARFGAWGAGRDLAAVLAVGLAVGLLGLLTPFVTGELFTTAIPEADRSLVLQLSGALLAAAIGTAAFHATRGLALLRIESRMDVTVQAAVWDRLLKLPTGFFRQFAAGELAARAGAISAIRQLLAGATISSVLSAVFSLLYVGLMLWYSVTLTLWAVGLTAAALAATLGAAYLQLGHQRKVSEIQSRLQGRVLQFLTGLTKLRVAGAEAKAFEHWARDFGTQRSLQVRARRVAIRLGTFNAAFPVFASLVLFGVVAWGDGGPLLPVGAFVAFHAAFGTFMASVLSLSGAFTAVLAAVPLYEQAEPILTALPEVDGSKEHPGELSGRLALERVTFRYEAGGPPTLRDVSISAEPGEFIALVGPSGSGKSTLLRLLLGFERPEAGAVTYDHRDLAELDVQAVRRQLGVVLQSGGLMQGDIFTNIAGSSGATHDDTWEAARMAGLDADIRSMPMGMHTVVSEGGGTLSGGQRQRLLIARAIVGRPRILFFDEATSALDNHTQATVSRSLEGLEATRVVVAHRLSTIKNADRIYVLDRGQVVQTGTYDALIGQPGLFAQLAARQLA